MKLKINRMLLLATSLMFANPIQVVAGTFDFLTINYSGLAEYKTYFSQAESFWEGALSGYKIDKGQTGITINASIASIDGVGGILGQAGVTSIWAPPSLTAPYLYSAGAVMQFDSSDIGGWSPGMILDVVMHEMAHSIGFGTLWDASWEGITYNDVLNNSRQYIGTNALAAYRAEFDDASAPFVPVELDGGSGTAYSHWDEPFLHGLSGKVDYLGRDMTNELMTGWYNSDAVSFVSNTTLQSFADIGYEVNAVPEPATMILFGAGLAGLAAARRRKKTC